jgi:hypothetical protein
MPPPPQNPGQGQGPKPKKEIKTFEFRIYALASGYTGELELLATTTEHFKDVFAPGGRPLSVAKHSAEEYVRNIGMFGFTIETPANLFNYYPPNRIAKIEYNEVDP